MRIFQLHFFFRLYHGTVPGPGIILTVYPGTRGTQYPDTVYIQGVDPTP